ncbi:MAG: dTMP kinase [Chromatiales bacterium]|nr:dTMP kinase [Chromatiales bacterium]
MPERGVLIAVEGIDGAGKTTQVERLVEQLRASGEAVVRSKEPTDGPHGQRIRRSAQTGRMSIEEELAAFEADRAEHLREVVEPAIARGAVVVLDRYFYSTIAYQGIRTGDVDGLDRRMRALARVPDLTLIVDIDPDRAMLRIARRDGRGNAFERLEDLKAIRAVFLEVAARDPVCQIVDGDRAVDAVAIDVLGRVVEGPLLAARCAAEPRCTDPTACAPGLAPACRFDALRVALRKARVTAPSR